MTPFLLFRRVIGIACLIFMPIVYPFELFSIPDPFKRGERSVFVRAWVRMWRIWNNVFWAQE